MGVSQQDVVNVAGVETESPGVLLVQLALTLIEPAVDEYAFPRTLDQMTGAGHAAVGAVERELQVKSSRPSQPAEPGRTIRIDARLEEPTAQDTS